MKTITVKPLSHRARLDTIARQEQCGLTSIGDIERLAGINTNSAVERQALWNGFRHLFNGPVQALFDAVMDHCAAIALRRIEAGELSLVKSY